MGGGGLVILKHKSWHVWNRDNRERVKKDEEQARVEAELAARRAEEAEQEYRLSVLRTRAAQSRGEDGDVIDVDEDGFREKKKREPVLDEEGNAIEDYTPLGSSSKPQHVNFFEDLERGKKRNGANTDHEVEKKKEQEKHEKKLGILVGLGQTVTDGGMPWYDKEALDARKIADQKAFERSRERQQAEDPFAAMMNSLKQKKKLQDSGRDAPRLSLASPPHPLHPVDGRDILREERLQREREARRQVCATIPGNGRYQGFPFLTCIDSLDRIV